MSDRQGALPVLIAGCTRSGTTLLARALDRHPGIAIVPETHFFNAVAGQRAFLGVLPRRRAAAVAVRAMALREYPATGGMTARKDAAEAALTAHGVSGKGFVPLLRALAAAPVIGEKTPWHGALASRILRADPAMKLIAIVRNPAATVVSVLGKPGFRRVATVTQCVARWRVINADLAGTLEAVGPERALLMRYEDLVRRPADELHRAAAFLGVPFDTGMLTPEFDESLRPGAGFDPSRAEAWRQACPAGRAERIAALAMPLTARFGYAQPERPAPLTAWIALRAEMAVQSLAVLMMAWGIYPFGAATDAVRRAVGGGLRA